MTKQLAIEEATNIAESENLVMVVLHNKFPSDETLEVSYEYCPLASMDYLFRHAVKDKVINPHR